jgi:hypothetical protein
MALVSVVVLVLADPRIDDGWGGQCIDAVHIMNQNNPFDQYQAHS